MKLWSYEVRKRKTAKVAMKAGNINFVNSAINSTYFTVKKNIINRKARKGIREN